MTKHNRKESRLSEQARYLLYTARISYATNPVNAALYLTNMDPKNLSMFDQQKIGREILARVSHTGNYSVFGELDKSDFKKKVANDYQVEEKSVRRNERHKPITEDYKMESVRRLMYSRFGGNANNCLREARRYFDLASNQTAFRKRHYIWAGNYFEEAGIAEKAVQSYKLALEQSENARLSLLSRKEKDSRSFECETKYSWKDIAPIIDGTEAKWLIRKIEENAVLFNFRNRRKAEILKLTPWAFGGSK